MVRMNKAGKKLSRRSAAECGRNEALGKSMVRIGESERRSVLQVAAPSCRYGPDRYVWIPFDPSRLTGSPSLFDKFEVDCLLGRNSWLVVLTTHLILEAE